MPSLETPRVKQNVHIVWFKTTDLRLHDHIPLCNAHECALKDSSASALHVLILDARLGYGPNAPKSREACLQRLGRLRAQFLLESILDLQNRFARQQQKLHVFVGSTKAVLRDLSYQFNVLGVHAHGPEFCSEEQAIEKAVKDTVAASRLHLTWAWTLHHIDDLPPKMQRGLNTPDRYKPFLQAVQKGKQSACARPPIDAPTKFEWAKSLPTVLPMVNEIEQLSLSDLLPKEMLEHSKSSVSTATTAIQKGGETEALLAMEMYIWEQDRLRHYVGSSDSMSPGKHNALNSTTGLSPYLAHGCLSPRRLYAEVRKYENKRIINRSTYWVFHELVFRDFFVFSAFKWKTSLFRIEGPLQSSGHPWRSPRQQKTKELFQRWTEGKTGYPFVDAGMRQLYQEGQMPHLLRQICAGFLVRDLRIDWRWGAEWFEQNLVDYTPDANYGNWGYRILPIPQILPLETNHITSLEILSWPLVHDPFQEYVLKWVPELKELKQSHPEDPIFIREPWRLAKRYRRTKEIDITPKKDSNLWIMSVNRANWPEYQKMMTGKAYMVAYEKDDSLIHVDDCPYPFPLVPPVEIEIMYDRIPVDNSWGDKHAADTKSPKQRAATSRHRQLPNHAKKSEQNTTIPSTSTDSASKETSSKVPSKPNRNRRIRRNRPSNNTKAPAN